jgi:pyrimidine operon attenuation protein/uracil phosphoribosyltransferase
MTANIPDEIPSSLPDAEKLYAHLLELLKAVALKTPIFN